jgi:Na+/H+-dicarboxylate symporter
VTESTATPSGIFGRWNAIPLYFRILIAMGIGVVTGLLLGEHAAILEIPSSVILQLLGALAPPLILVAVIHVLMTSEIKGSAIGRLAFLLILNTIVAICVGLTVANVLQPGAGAQQVVRQDETKEADGPSPLDLLVANVPKSILGPLGDKTNIIGIILIAVAFGIALRDMRATEVNTIKDVVQVAYDVLLKVLHWVIYLVPLGVFGVVARVVGTEGFGPFKRLGAFIVAVLLALALQTTWYLVRIRFFSRFKPLKVLSGMKDALVMAFSTDSSTITMPVTYACLREKVGVNEEAASLGALVGANFNNDGTALYEAMAALFVAQMLGIDLSMTQQLIVVFTSIIASVGAAGIPEAGLVTMTLVFTAVKLPIEYIGLLLTVDWFLDRCRTTINVLGDVNVSCLLDAKTQPDQVTQ